MKTRAGRPERADISVVGEINADLIFYGLPDDLPEERELLASEFKLTLGGSAAILAHNLARLGSRVKFASMVGSGPIGEFCCKWLDEAGVNSCIRAGGEAQAGVTVILPHGATRRILTYPGVMFEMSYESLDQDYLASATHFHMSSLFLHRKLRSRIPDLFREMKSRGLTTSLDTNDDPEDKWAWEFLQEVLAPVDILFCNERELVKISRQSEISAAVKQLARRVSLLVVKRGPSGASVFGDKCFVIGGLAVETIDTIGAGDSFDAGFLHRWVRGDEIAACLRFANVAGALSTTRRGGVEAFRDGEYVKQFFEKNLQKRDAIEGKT